ncbi:MAG: HipA N-terminal domain-containing protein [Brumimicrobium sp.]
MRKAKVIYKNEWAGTLAQQDDGSFEFLYQEAWVNDSSKPSISLTLPKQKEPFCSKYLFPFFYNMLPEGTNKQVVCYHLRIDEEDYFGILMATAKSDVIGAVRIIKIEES